MMWTTMVYLYLGRDVIFDLERAGRPIDSFQTLFWDKIVAGIINIIMKDKPLQVLLPCRLRG